MDIDKGVYGDENEPENLLKFMMEISSYRSVVGTFQQAKQLEVG